MIWKRRREIRSLLAFSVPSGQNGRVNVPLCPNESAAVVKEHPNVTNLNLLTRDGAVTVTFLANLNGEQYSKLHDVIHYAVSREELRECIRKIANEWRVQTVIDDA